MKIKHDADVNSQHAIVIPWLLSEYQIQTITTWSFEFRLKITQRISMSWNHKKMLVFWMSGTQK